MNYVNDTKAKGAFVTFWPILLARGGLNLQIPITKIFPYGKDSTVIEEVPYGVYFVAVYDVESDGYLMMPIAKPAFTSTVVILGQLTIEDTQSGFQNDEAQYLEINAAVDFSDLTLTIVCNISDQIINADSFLVALRSLDDPENLMVKVQKKTFSKPLVYDVNPQTNYTVTVFTVNNSSVLNSTIRSMEIYVGKFVIKISQNYWL